MKPVLSVLIFMLFLGSCIVQFVPETDEDQDILVVEGLITDEPGTNTVKLSRSQQIGLNEEKELLSDCIVWISDDYGNDYYFDETEPGVYQTDPNEFRGIVGRCYTLHINTASSYNNLTFESYPVEMKPVPSIDSTYYEKILIRDYSNDQGFQTEGCQIYLNTFDPSDSCFYFRWEYSETWEFHIPFTVENNVCWVSENSSEINIKNASLLEDININKYPLLFISDVTDRLREKYCILVKQYSLNEEEYIYWEKLRNIYKEVGGLYDIIPANVPSNIWCIENPGKPVLGYFSVSATSSTRMFIDEHFNGITNPYSNCVLDTIWGGAFVPIPYLNSKVWILEDHTLERDAPYRTITDKTYCLDCTLRGTLLKPDFWPED